MLHIQPRFSFKMYAWLLLGVVAVARGQHATSMTFNSDGSSSVGGRLGLAHNDRNALSALFSQTSTGAVGKGLSLDNVNGHGLSLQHTSVPGFGSQLTGAGRLGLLQNDKHALGAGAFLTRNMPNIPQVPNFNTVGGNLDYMYRNRVGATLGVAHTPLLQRTDYSALGKLNLFHSPSSSVDLNAGVSRSMAPQFNTGWQPTGGLTFTKFFG